MLTGLRHRFTFCALLLLAACSRGGAEDPAIVLERAVANAQRIESARFDISFFYSSETDGLKLDGTANGVLGEGGRQLSFSFDADITTRNEGADQTVEAGGDIIVTGENESYMRITRADGSVLFLPGIGLVPEDMLNRWFALGGTSSGAAAVTPDPSFIAMQTHALRVLRDRSYEKVDGFRCYAYDVTIDAPKLVEFLETTAKQREEPFDRPSAQALIDAYDAEGTVWIDESSSVIRRISWTFTGKDSSTHSRASLSLHLQDHNLPVKIAPPIGAVPMNDVLSDPALPSL